MTADADCGGVAGGYNIRYLDIYPNHAQLTHKNQRAPHQQPPAEPHKMTTFP